MFLVVMELKFPEVIWWAANVAAEFKDGTDRSCLPFVSANQLNCQNSSLSLSNYKCDKSITFALFTRPIVTLPNELYKRNPKYTSSF